MRHGLAMGLGGSVSLGVSKAPARLPAMADADDRPKGKKIKEEKIIETNYLLELFLGIQNYFFLLLIFILNLFPRIKVLSNMFFLFLEIKEYKFLFWKIKTRFNK